VLAFICRQDYFFVHPQESFFNLGGNKMNSQGLIFVLGGVSSVLSLPFYDTLVKDGKLTQAELDSTRERFKDVIDTLKKAPANKIEALVAQYNAELTEHLDKFNQEWTTNYLAAFQDAEIMLGFVISILGKAGIREG
jgi:hypothetical protein